jgi:alpha amylase, C-terminal all-beta domain
LPLPGHWHVRFNSSWHGYSKDFRGVHLSSVNTHKNSTATITLPPYGVYILSQE